GTSFGQGDDVGIKFPKQAGEPGAQSAKAADDFNRDKQDVVLATELAQCLQIPVRRHDDAACALHRFDEHRCNRFGSFTLDDAGRLLDAPLAVGGWVERTADAVRMWRGRMDETGEWEIKWPSAVWQSGQAGSG